MASSSETVDRATPEEQSESTPRAEPPPDPDWYAEIEFRRYLRDNVHLNEADRQFIPTEPDPQRAEDAEARDYLSLDEVPRSDAFKQMDYDFTTIDDEYYPDVWTVEWHEPGGVEIEPDRIVVTLDKVKEIPKGELESWVIENVLDGMFVRDKNPKEDLNPGTVVMGSMTDNFGKYGIHLRQSKGEFHEKFENIEATNAGRGRGQIIRFVHDPRPVYVRVPPGHDLNKLDQLWKRRREQSRDMKMLVTARDGATGTGKTTLAVALAKAWDEHGWDVSKATLSPSEYVERYTELDTGEILIGDEMEQMADPRRSMSKQNVTLTQYWSTMRQWEVSTIATLPSAAMVDKRLRELMDIRLNVIRRGVAIAYKKKIDDHSGEIKEKRLHRVRWNPLDDDPDYRELAKMKKRHMENFNETAYFLAEEDEDETLTPEEARREFRNETIRRMAEEGYPQKEIAGIFDLSRPRISQILNGGDDGGD